MQEQQHHDHPHRPHSLFWPILLIAGGVFLFLSNLHILTGDTWDLVFRLWPLLLIAGGLDGLYRRTGFVGAVVLIGLGTVFLLGNLGYLMIGSWEIIWRFWPVLLLALGLDLIIGRRSAWSALAGVALGVLLIGAIIYISVIQPFTTTPGDAYSFTQDLTGAKRAEIFLEPVIGRMEVSSGAEGQTLVQGKLNLTGLESRQENYSVEGGTGTFRLGSSGTYMGPWPFFGSNSQPGWSIQLNSIVPLTLNSELVIGDHLLDLRGLTLEELDASTVIGRTVLSLPQGGEWSGKLDQVIGMLVVRVPKGASVRIVTEALSVGGLPAGYRRDGNEILSPAALEGGADITLRVELPLGTIYVEEMP
jgi:hypothetical protein